LKPALIGTGSLRRDGRDDRADLRRVVRRVLSIDGHEVTGAADGAEAPQILEQQSFDIPLTDIHMPSFDGIEFIRRLRIGGKRIGDKWTGRRECTNPVPRKRLRRNWTVTHDLAQGALVS